MNACPYPADDPVQPARSGTKLLCQAVILVEQLSVESYTDAAVDVGWVRELRTVWPPFGSGAGGTGD